MVVREQREQRQDGNNLILNLGCPVRDMLGQSMQPQIRDADQDDGDDKQADRETEQDVAFSRRGYETRQMMRCRGITLFKL